MRHRFVLLMLLLGLAISAPAWPATARELCFPQQPGVAACFADPFVDYWESNGGLPIFGYPLAPSASVPQPDGAPDLLTQWTERVRLESHPDNPAPYAILIGRLGAERLAQLGRDPFQEGRENGPTEGCLWFAETGHNVCDQVAGVGFQSYWQSHGLKIPGLSAYDQSLQLFGLPLTTAQIEVNNSGAAVLTQWFERARFEWHPDNPEPYQVLLGLLGREIANGSRPTSVFGTEISAGAVGASVVKASAAGATWARYNAMSWDTVEPTPGARNWSALSRAEAEIKLLTVHGLTPIVVVRGTPGWARQIPSTTCSPIKPEALDAFAAFMRELVARYSQPPYLVRYWEVWNEPDADTQALENSAFGCWADLHDPYYGGGAFGEMLKHVYPAVKQADPDAQVVLGGLLLDCDPARPPAGKDCRSASFLEGVLRNGGGAAFDVLAYHSYAYWWPPRKVDWDLSRESWGPTGGTMGKLAFLRGVLGRYNLDKPIMLNEAALLCVQPCPHENYDPAQANYIVRLYTRAAAQRLIGVIWYTFDGPGWREAGLLDGAQEPRLGYQAYKFLATLLKDTEYVGPFSQGAMEGYSFRKGATVYRICWTNDGSTVSLPLPANTSAIYDMLGRPLDLSSNSPNVMVGHEPLVISSS
jgi:hypothetical protein